LPAEIFPYCDELHLRRYDALFGVVHLGDGAPGSGLEREATAPWKRLQATPRFAERQPLCALGQVSVVARLDRAAMVLFDISAGDDPLAPGCGEPIMHIARDVGVTPGPARVIDSNGGVVFNMVMRPAGRTQVDLAKRYLHAFDTAIDIDSPG